MEHLSELRTRLLHILLYVFLGTVVAWLFYGFFFQMLSAPVTVYLKKNGGQLLITGVAEGFILKMQISILIGLIISMPFVTWEAWAFIAPGLRNSEKRGVKLVAPLSALLFASGVATAYWVLPAGIEWLASENPPGAKFMPSAKQTILFIIKMCLAFGLVFQLPVILMFLAKIGIINSRLLKTYWRHAVVIISIIAAVVVPSNDAFSMIMMFIPMVILYVLSIGLVKLVEKK